MRSRGARERCATCRTRLTPTSTSLTVGRTEAVSREITELKADTASEKTCLDGGNPTEGTISANKNVLDGEGTSKDSNSESIDTARLIPNNNSEIIKNLDDKKNLKVKNKILKRFSFRVPVLYPDGKPGMPTTNKRANKWLKEGKAKTVKNKLNVFAIQLKFWPIYRNTQPIVICIDPGSTFTGIAVMSKKCILISYMLELPGYKKDSKPIIIEKKLKNGKTKKIEKWHNTIVERMETRSRLRRSRRHRNCRRREERWLNRSKNKLAPSMLAKKQLELETVKVLSKLYPVTDIGFEDVSFNHYKDVYGIKGQSFSHVEIGKNWLLDRLRKIAEITIIKGYDTARRREQLKIPKSIDKTARSRTSHANDCVAMGTIILNLNRLPPSRFKFDVISRPKYARRVLFAEEPGKGGIFERYGGHIPNDEIFKGLRKGDYVEAKAPRLKNVYRVWISGYTGDRIYVSSYDWEQYPSFSVDNVKLLDRNHGLINSRLSWIKDQDELFDQMTGIKQIDAEGNDVNIIQVKEMINRKKKEEKRLVKKSNEMYKTIQMGADGNITNIAQIGDTIKMKKKEENDIIKKSNDTYKTIQKGIDDAWN